MSACGWFCCLGSSLLFSVATAAAQGSATYTCVGGVKAGASCNPGNKNADCTFCDEGVHQAMSCTSAVDCAPDGTCRGLCESVPQDPVGAPARYSLFRDDQIWITAISQNALKGDWAQTDTNVRSFTATSIGSGSSYTDVAPANDDIAQTRGRFRDAKSDRVLQMYKVSTSSGLQYKVISPNAGAEPSWQQSPGEPGGPIPSVTFSVPTQNVRSPAAIAAGDLDHQTGADGFFHDEAVIAFEGADHSVQVQVLDYQHAPGVVTVTASGSAALGTLATLQTQQGTVLPGSLAVGIGDFDGDLSNEIAVLWQSIDTSNPGRPLTRLRLAILRYVNVPPAAPLLDVVKANVTFANFFDQGSHVELPSLDLVTGDFDGDFIDEIAFAYIGDAVTVGTATKAVVKIIGLDTNFNQNKSGQTDVEEYSNLPTDGSFPLGFKPRLAAGLFHYDPLNGFGIGRRQLALLWWADRAAHASAKVWDVVTIETGLLSLQGANTNITQPLPGSGVALPGQCEFNVRQCYRDQDCNDLEEGNCQFNYSQVVVPRLSLTAGNFRGGDPTALNDSVPLWYLAAGYSSGTFPGNVQGNIQFLSVTDGILDTTFTYPTSSNPAANTEFVVQAYDRNGKSVFVGPPALLTVNQLVKPDVIIQEPPKHCDWFGRAGGGQFMNITRLAGLAITMTDDTQTVYQTKTTTGSDWTIGGSIGVKVSDTLEVGDADVEGGSVGASADLKVSGSFTEKNEDYNSRSQSYDFNVTSSTTEDDLVGGSYRTIFIWRYPIIGFALTGDNGKPLTDPNGNPLNGFYEISLPGEVGTFQPAAGLNFDWYQPLHENGNVLSYPQISADAANPVAVPDLGTYSLPGDMVCSNGAMACTGGTNQGQSCGSDADCPDSDCVGKKCLGDADCRSTALSNATCDPAPKRQTLLNTSYFIDANTQTISLNIASSVGGGSTRTTSGTLSEDLDVNVSANVTASEFVVTDKTSVSVDVDINNSNSWSKLRESTHETTSSMGFELSKNCGSGSPGLPCNDPSHAYQAATAYYYTGDGTQKVAHAVDLLGSTSGQSFWLTKYGGKADPALNLPQRIILVTNQQSGDVNIPNWNDSFSHQRIRGFFVLHDDDPNAPALSNVPFASAVTDGDKVKFQVRVYNYSLDTAAAHVNVLFVALPVNPSDNAISGAAIPLCDVVGGTCPVVSPLGPLQMQTAELRWDTTGHGPSTPGSQLYRIFVILDPDCRWDARLPCGGLVDEIHEWQDRYGFPPTVDGTRSGDPIVDPFTGNSEVLESGQNNQGFGELAIYAKSSTVATASGSFTAEPHAPDVFLRQDAIAARARGGQIVTQNVTATIDRTLNVRVIVAADGATPRAHHVHLYDGDPNAGGQLIGVRTLLGIDHVNGSPAWFDWLPRRLGEHRLYARVLEHHDDTQRGNTTTTLTVNVVAAPTVTPTPTPPPKPTAPPARFADDDGCAITAPHPSAAWPILIGPAVLLWWRTRRGARVCG